MRLLERLYRSPLGRGLSKVAWGLSSLGRPRMLYGYCDPATGVFRKYTRISSATAIVNPRNLSMGDHVWVSPFSVLDATEGLTVGEGAQISSWVGLFTHGSANSIRLLGRDYVHTPFSERRGYTRGPVAIGAYTFIGAGTVVLPGVAVGKGCIVGAMSLVTKDVPDYAVVRGQPAKIVGDTREIDRKLLQDEDFSSTYYDANVLAYIRQGVVGKRAPPGEAIR